jgi:outer membrane PBP1 activator LpoA protein
MSELVWAEVQISPLPDDATLTHEEFQEVGDVRNIDQKAHIALLLPLKSIPFWQDAEAVRDGFFAATQVDEMLNQDHDDLPIRVYECEEEGRDLPALYAQAVANGAVAVVGGLTFRGYRALTRDVEITVPTLTLYVWKDAYREVNVYKYGNASFVAKVADGLERDNLYFFGLSPEDEARAVARQAIKNGGKFAIIVTNNKQWSRMLSSAFHVEYMRLHANTRFRILYTGDPSVFYSLRVKDHTVIFLATNGEEAKAILPLLPKGTPVYATSRVFDGREDNAVLAGVHFVDMPWVVHADNPTIFDYPSANMPLTPERERLYALGIDAHKLMRMLLDSLGAVELVSEFGVVDGVSGTIRLANQTFSRSALPVKFDGDGRITYDNPPKPVQGYVSRRIRRDIRMGRKKQKPFEFYPDEGVLNTELPRGENPTSLIKHHDNSVFTKEVRDFR